MPLFDTDYATLAELKAYLRIADTVDDVQLGFALTAASRAVDQATNRTFGVDGSVVARRYTYEGDVTLDGRTRRQFLPVHDISSVTGLLVKLDEGEDGTYEKALTIDAVTDGFYLAPTDATVNGKPFEAIVARGVSFPAHPRGIQVTATFGWATIPVTVKQATLLQASRFVARRNAPFGIAGSLEMGSELRLLARVDPDVAVTLSRYKRHWAAA